VGAKQAQKKPSSAQRWKVTDLKEHPKQAEIFGDVSESELQDLAELLRKEGQRHPVEILPSGVVLAGHQRVRAAKLLGWSHVDVVIRHDLADAGPAAAEMFFIQDNLVRRQLSPLARARCIQQLFILESKSRFGLDEKSKEKLKAKIALQHGLSVRSVNRYLLLLTAPTAVQRAFDQGRLSLVDACKVAGLPRETKAEIARRIDADEKPNDIVKPFLKGTKETSDVVDASFLRMLRALKRELPTLTKDLTVIQKGRVDRNRDFLKDAIVLLNKIVRRKGA